MTHPAHTNQANIDAQRKRELGLIHQAKAALHWSDDDYRYHLLQQTGHASAADLDAAGRRKMIEHLASCGWAPRIPFKSFGQPEKIRWLWRKLAEAGAVHDASNHALLAFVGRTTGTGVADVRFLPPAQASTVIEALKSWLGRAQRAHGGTHG